MGKVTLAADGDLRAKAWAYASARNTTLNELVRDYLDRLTGGTDPQQAADEFAEVARSRGGRSREGFVFSRAAAHSDYPAGFAG